MAAPASGIGSDEIEGLFTTFEGRRGIVLAVSGGADSTAMMVLASRWRQGVAGVPVCVATIDHGLRPEAAAECERVRQWAGELGLTCHVLHIPAGTLTRNVQERARDARYALLDACAIEIGADAIATAHTLEDQAETVMMRLVHGSSIDGLGAMRPLARRGSLAHLRPLLGTSRQRLLATLQSGGFGWIEDPSNQDLRFERVRLRRLLPTLESHGLTAERLALLAVRAARASEALDTAAAGLLGTIASREPGAIHLDTGALFASTRELRIRAISQAIREVVTTAPRIRLERLEELERTLAAAAAAGAPLRRTLGGAVLTLTAGKAMAITAERQRSRGFCGDPKSGS